MSEYKIPAKEIDSVMQSFWTMMRECETIADNDNDMLLKHQVECWYRQWNKLTARTNEPRWITQNKDKNVTAV